MKYITSAQNEQLKHLAKLLSSAKERRLCRQTVLEGTHLLDACLKAGWAPQGFYIPESKAGKPEIQALLQQFDEQKTVIVGSAALSKITSLTEGEEVMTLVSLPDEPSLPDSGDCVVLEHVQDPGNVGTILRSAAAAGVQQVVLSKECAEVWSPKVLRAGMGAHFLLKLHTRADLNVWRERYQGRVWATALGCNNRSLYDLNLQHACAWIFGNEGSGVSETMQQAADATVRIPMLGATESLNVAMAATVCLFEQMRQRL
ncbi:TrmH family RNA methyltransferase [Neisseria canis]|uniref:RNA methyltransferase n=1 Tax=Neisseria canis TaxID=493 RepID=A0A448D9D2_9NEIS|nr:RNA methyltransferase [Neisseria canis]OSI11779.1 RNA methyltransferase [Neisseria canis]VEF02292.1 RNA methyltransferase [Neisseria canis]